VFNYETESWESKRYALPWIEDDFVILTPRDVLTRDENWINRKDLSRGFEEVPTAIPDEKLRAQVSNYFEKVLARPANKDPSQRDYDAAAARTISQFPQLIDYYIRLKEQQRDDAVDISSEKVRFMELMFVDQLRYLQAVLRATTDFVRAQRARKRKAPSPTTSSREGFSMIERANTSSLAAETRLAMPRETHHAFHHLS
jgi:hypothetical protein